MTSNLHIKLEYSEAINAKKDLLYSEENLIEIAKTIRKYKSLRITEMKLKLKLQKLMKDGVKDLNSLEQTLPKVEIPEILLHGKESITEKVEVPSSPEDKNLERQLEEIQRKLRNLEG